MGLALCGAAADAFSMPIVSSPVPPGQRKFDLEAANGSKIEARLAGRSLVRGLLIADRIDVAVGSDPVEPRRAFARAFADACSPADGDVLVVETPESAIWQDALTAVG